MRSVAALLLALPLLSDVAFGGALTLHQQQFAAFVGTITSSAPRRYDDQGASSVPVVFDKLLVQDWMEYGLTNALTIVVAPEYVLADYGADKTSVSHVESESIEAGMRLLLSKRFGMLSLQTTAKWAGAFDMSVSSRGEPGRQFEVRLLYGESFKLLWRDAFVDVEIARRWISRPRPDEIVWDGTAGWWITKRNLLMLQSFNVTTTGGIRSPYEAYDLSKLQLSIVHRSTPHWSVQSGYFFSMAGRNIVKESGFTTMIWFRT